MSDVANAWNMHHAVIDGFLRRRLGNEADAEDLSQETFLRLHRVRPMLPDSGAVRAWLLRTAGNLVADHYRSARPVAPLDVEPPAVEPELPTALDTLQSCIGPLTARLPEKYREALRQDLEGAPQTEIARRHGIGLSGAKSRVQRARRMLRREFDRCCTFSHDGDGTVLDYRERACAVPCHYE